MSFVLINSELCMHCLLYNEKISNTNSIRNNKNIFYLQPHYTTMYGMTLFMCIMAVSVLVMCVQVWGMVYNNYVYMHNDNDHTVLVYVHTHIPYSMHVHTLL